MELNYNKELFKELLATLRTHLPECHKLEANEVIFFNSKFHAPKAEYDSRTIPYYSELSSGEFTLALEDETLKEKFLHTKKLITKNMLDSTE
jgi:hypothetical protein